MRFLINHLQRLLEPGISVIARHFSAAPGMDYMLESAGLF